MSKRLKKFILFYFKSALVLGVVLVIYDQVGPYVAGGYFNLIEWGIEILSFAILAFIGWRLWVGIETGYLLYDDPTD